MSKKNDYRSTIMALRMALAVVVVCLVAACGTSRHAAAGHDNLSAAPADGAEQLRARRLAFVQKVYDNAVYVKSLTSKIDLTLGRGSDGLTVAGTLKMRRDEMIRLQVTPMGLMEVGRLEFTPDSVLVIDRINKEYARAAYDELTFLADNGIDFYTLQSLFWNELFLPGEHMLTESHLRAYDVDLAAGSSLPVSYVRGPLTYVWHADATTAQIGATTVSYTGSDGAPAALRCAYGSFVPVGSKLFPTELSLTFSDSGYGGYGATLALRLKGIDTAARPEAPTVVNAKYRRVTAADILTKLMSL